MTAIPLEVAAPIGAALVTGIVALWRQLINERANHEKILQLEREKADKAQEAELRAREAEMLELRKELRENREKRIRDQTLYLRSLGVRPLSSLPPAEGIPPKK